MTTRTMATPLTDALTAAIAAAEAAQSAYDSDDAEPEGSEWDALRAAERVVDMAVVALSESGEPREWRLIEDGQEYDTVTAGSPAAALEIARSNVDRGNYPADEQDTIWIDIRVHCDLTGEDAGGTVQLDPEEPECEAPHHDWRSPYSLLGGIAENPGCWGHGGGVIVREVCSHCGVYRVTDTWAQRPDNGEQGYTTVAYEDADDGSLAWVERRRDREQAEAAE